MESATVVRADARRRRKAEAFAIETKAQASGSHDTMNQDPLWKDAIPVLDEALDRLPPHERNAVLQRFCEGKKFREIAEESGQSEAA